MYFHNRHATIEQENLSAKIYLLEYARQEQGQQTTQKKSQNKQEKNLYISIFHYLLYDRFVESFLHNVYPRQKFRLEGSSLIVLLYTLSCSFDFLHRATMNFHDWELCKASSTRLKLSPQSEIWANKSMINSHTMAQWLHYY